MSSSVSEEWQIFSKADSTFAYLRSALRLHHAAEMRVKIFFTKPVPLTLYADKIFKYYLCLGINHTHIYSG